MTDHDQRYFDRYVRVKNFWNGNSADFAPTSVAATEAAALIALLTAVTDARADQIRRRHTGNYQPHR